MNYSYNHKTSTEEVGVTKYVPNNRTERSPWTEGLAPSPWAPRVAGQSQNKPSGARGVGDSSSLKPPRIPNIRETKIKN